jgi:glycosyltransferase involved in cell wall biosynthesis
MPFFSVIIPLYNKENYIEATLKSVLAQTFIDFEIIIINDVSTDNSLLAAQSIKDIRIHIIEHEVNKGLSASRNTGIREAKSDYIAFLDADDLWKPGFLDAIHKLTNTYPEAQLFSTTYEAVYPENSIVHPFDIQTGLLDNFFTSNLNQSIYYPSSLCVKKSVFEEIGYYDECITFAEDIDFNIRAHLHFKMAYCNEPFMSYTMTSENQITHASLKNKVITDFDKYEKLYPERKDLKTYLDFNRYVTAKLYKMSGDSEGFKKMLKGISLSSLNYKQIILLYSPVFVLKLIKKVKAKLIKKGINPTSY